MCVCARVSVFKIGDKEPHGEYSVLDALWRFELSDIQILLDKVRLHPHARAETQYEEIINLLLVRSADTRNYSFIFHPAKQLQQLQ